MRKNILGMIIAAGLMLVNSSCTTTSTTEPLEVMIGKRERDKMRYVSDKIQYGVEDYRASADSIKAIGYRGDCDKIATIVANAMVEEGYPPLVLDIYRDIWPIENARAKNFGIREINNIPRFFPNEKRVGHEIFVYQHEGKWGAIGVSSFEDRAPRYDKITDLIDSLKSVYDANGWEKKSFVLTNLDEAYPNGLWRNGNGNLLAKKDFSAKPVASGSN